MTIQIDEVDKLEASVIDLQSDLNVLVSAEEVNERIQRFVESTGFSSIDCLKAPRAGEKLKNCSFMSTQPPQWCARYLELNYILVDPLIEHAVNSSEPFQWSEIINKASNSFRAEQINKERAAFGLSNGFTVPIHGFQGYVGVVSFAGREDMTNACRVTMTVAAHVIHNHLTALSFKKPTSNAALTSRELECLKWAADGKSDWEISQILQVSPKTVNYHIERAKRKFDVTTRIQAVIRAHRLGILI